MKKSSSLLWRAGVLVAFAALLSVCISSAWAQTSNTGALSGTVTDQTGAVIANATVTVTNLGTGQTRTTKTNANGSYTFGLLSPGSYSVKISAAGFEASEVPSVAVNVTETASLNRSLQVGAQTQEVTVTATSQAIQTQSSANGGLVSGQEITSLPLVSRNYTQVLSLSPGVVANASNAAAVGNGTVDVSANGSTANENNYSMNGSSVVNYVSGTAAQEGSFPGIVIPNPDAIQEFKVQTSLYDASSGRNPGANVDVVTKTGTNNFHGDLWEFNRNNMFNANDFYYKHSELAPGGSGINAPQTLKQNTFGFTIGGPIIKNKLFFFGSYQGIRQINGIGTSGFAAGYSPNTQLLPWNDYADFKSGLCTDLRCTNNPAAYKTYLGSVFGGQGLPPFYSSVFNTGTGRIVAANGSNISNTAVSMLQAPGVVKGGFNQGFYFPSAPNVAGCLGGTGCTQAISDPLVANEDQYIADSQYVINSKNTMYEHYIFQRDPQFQPFNCFILAGNCNPGAPVNAYYGNHVAQLQLTTVATSNFVNDLRFDFHRDIENNADPNAGIAGLNTCSLPNGGSIIPIVNNGSPSCLPTSGPNAALYKRFPEMTLPPILDIVGVSSSAPGYLPSAAWSQGGNFSMISSNFIDTFQEGDDISWTHGKHTIRAGVDAERIDYNNTIPASGRGELLMADTASFLTSSAGLVPDGTPQTANGGILLGFGLKGALTHYNRANAFDGYVQDDVKATSKLTLNLGVRWEYDGFPNDISGQFSNVWGSQLGLVNTGSAFNALGPYGTLAGFVVPSNFNRSGFPLTGPQGQSGVLVNNNQTLVPGTPLDMFEPRLGFAWQPLGDRFVVRGGYGIYYDRIYSNLLIDNQLNLPPYSGAATGPFPANLANTLHTPWAVGVGPLQWTPRYMLQNTATVAGLPVQTPISSGLTYTSDSPQMASRLPMTQQYSLDTQYEFYKGWIADIGFVGSHSTHLYNWSQDVNVANLVPGAPNNPTAASGYGNQEMVKAVPYNDPGNANPIAYNTVANTDGRVPYLGFAPGGVATTNSYGDSLYDSLQAQLKHEFANGLLLQVSYTWSKLLTNVDSAVAGSGIQPPGEVLFGSGNSNDPLDMAQQYGLASFNRPQRVVISYVYNLPYKGTEGFKGKMLSGWSLSGVTTIQDGLPFWLVDSGGGSIYYGTGSGNSRAALFAPVNCSAATGNCHSAIPIATSGSTTSRAYPGNNWVNPSAFTPLASIKANSPYCIGGVPNPGGLATDPCGAGPNPFTGDPGATFVGAGTGFGNSPIGSIYGPGQFNFDMSLIKDTKVTEWGTLEFRIEAYNLFNHPQFEMPFNNNVNAPVLFGQITSTAVTPRVFQFGLKFLF